MMKKLFSTRLDTCLECKIKGTTSGLTKGQTIVFQES